MQKPSALIGQCSNGHDVHVTHDLNGGIDGGTIGTGSVKPLPDGRTNKPIVVACEACVELINERIQAQT
jgi:hypothetical protein